jgi:hypothetical protein
MKASFPCIFLVILTVLLATPAMGWFKEKSAPVAIDPLVQGWELGPASSKDDAGTTLIIASGHGLKFYPNGSESWMVHNQFERFIHIRVHIKDNDGNLMYLPYILGPGTPHTRLGIPHSKELIVDVTSIGPIEPPPRN